MSPVLCPEDWKTRDSEDIRSRKLTDRERRTLKRIAANQAAGRESQKSLRLIPPLTGEQLAAMVHQREARPRKQAVTQACHGITAAALK